MFCSDVDDRVELDRVGQVVDEKDEKAEAREEQQDCPGDREPRKLLDAAAGYTDCVKPRHTVGEGRDEHAEHDLVGPVAEEVAQQPLVTSYAQRSALTGAAAGKLLLEPFPFLLHDRLIPRGNQQGRGSFEVFRSTELLTRPS